MQKCGVFVFVHTGHPRSSCARLRGRFFDVSLAVRHGMRKHLLATLSVLDLALNGGRVVRGNTSKAPTNVLFCACVAGVRSSPSFLQGDYLQRQHLLLHAERRTHLAHSKCVLESTGWREIMTEREALTTKHMGLPKVRNIPYPMCSHPVHLLVAESLVLS